MNFKLIKMKVTLSKDQKREIHNAFINRKKIRLVLKKEALRGSDTLLVPRSFYKDSLNAVADEGTLEEMKDEIQEELESFRDEKLIDEEICEWFKSYIGEFTENEVIEIFRNINLSDEMLREIIHEKVWQYYGLFFNPNIVESMENRGIAFDLDYSLLDDPAKIFIKKLLFKKIHS